MEFLLREDIVGPATVDNMVWARVNGSWGTGHPLSLASSVTEILSSELSCGSPNANTFDIIEISVVIDKEAGEYWGDVFYGMVSPEFDRDLQIRSITLGFDVADHFLISGLSNCGYSSLEIAGPRRAWARFINEVGLFGDLQDAQRFCSVCDLRVSEHAPFAPFLIRKVDVLGEKGQASIEAGNLGETIK